MNYMPLIVKDLPYAVHADYEQNGYFHWHSEMELYISLRGEQTVEAGEQTYRLRAGDALILPGYVAHSCSARDPDNYRVAINFGHSLLRNRYAAVQSVSLFIPADESDTPPQLRATIRALHDIFLHINRVSDDNEWRIRGNLFLLCDYLQTLPRREDITAEQQKRIQMLDSIFTVLHYVEKHYAEKISVGEMAKLAKYAQTYFCHQFKRATGYSFYRYLTRYRIQVACNLLDASEKSIGEVAVATGFSTHTLFCRAFKECIGCTPVQYRSLHSQEKDRLRASDKEEHQ